MNLLIRNNFFKQRTVCHSEERRISTQMLPNVSMTKVISYNLWQRLTIASLIFIFSCGEKTHETPANIIPRETFVQVLVDFALAESAANTNIKNVPNNQADSVYNFNPLEENNITKAQYDSALVFYSSHTELYKEIYQEVLQRLNAMQTRRDSLRNKK